MQVRVMPECLTPGMQHCQKANLCTEVFRVASNGEQGLGGGAEEQVVNDTLVLQRHHGQLFRQRKHHMEIGHGQKVGETCFDPTPLGQRLTLGTMAVATGVVSDALIAARVALLEVTTQHTGATDFNSTHHAPLLWQQRKALAKVLTVLA
jgi:hypothetical protein